MGSTLAPALLLSMPQLVDPNFSRTVVLLCKHNEDGALGLVVNRPLVTTGRVTVQLDPPVSTDRELQVWVGGPVEPHRSWVLVGEEPDEEEDLRGMRIARNLYLSTSPDLLRRLLEPSPPVMAPGRWAGPTAGMARRRPRTTAEPEPAPPRPARPCPEKPRPRQATRR